MTPRKTQPTPAAVRARPRTDGQSTPRRLVEAAGQVFAAKGFDRATAKEICRRARTNTAAVNYYFDGIEGLYAAVVREANRRLVSFDALSAAVAERTDAKARLETFMELLVGALTGPASTSWVLRVIGREFVAPSPALDALRSKEMLPKAGLLRNIVGELMGLPEDDPAVARGCVTVLGPCILLLVGDRRTLRRAFPQLSLAAQDAPGLARHMVRFALAGLAAVAEEAREAPTT